VAPQGSLRLGHKTESLERTHDLKGRLHIPDHGQHSNTLPPNTIRLFNGKDRRNWTRRDSSPALWHIEDGVLYVKPGTGDIMTQEKLTDFFLHLEFRCPYMPEATGQAKGNSGVFLQGRYEIQVLDSYGITIPGKGDCGAIYDQFAPLVNACKPPMVWQSYEVIFRGARSNKAGIIREPARVTILQNSIVIHNNIQIFGVTAGAIDEHVSESGPILLQDHGDLVAYRNIWAVPLPLRGSAAYEPR